ncbi:MAG: hypothetical protein GF313_01160 [Caldithrix sp.]|nr:hypothetical protein [Caldithrix sp.]
MRSKLSTLLIVSFVLSMFAFLSEAQAIPAFARKYKISCTTCHTAMPKLKAYGDEIAGNGFIIPEDESKRDYVTAGDDLLLLNRNFPIAARLDLRAVHNSDENTDIDTDLQTPWGLKLLSGGAIYKNISYYFYFYASERGEVAGIEDAYIHFNNIFGKELDIMAGQFQTSDPLMKRELRLTVEDYQAYKTPIGYSNTDLTYDRGLMFVYGLTKTSTDIIAMVVNGNGIGEAGGNKIFDDDKYKNLGLRINQGIGDKVSIGGFAYYGKEDIRQNQYNGENEVTYLGPDVNVNLGTVEFTGQYLLRTDSEPMANMEDVETNGIIAEVIYAPQKDKSRFYFIGLYNNVDCDLDAYDYETATLSATYLLARNIRLLAEATRDMHNESNRLVLGVVSAF